MRDQASQSSASDSGAPGNGGGLTVKRRESKVSSGSDTPTASSPYASRPSGSAQAASSSQAQGATKGSTGSAIPRRVPFPVSQPSTDRIPQRVRPTGQGPSGTSSFHQSQPSTSSAHASSPTSVVSNLPTGLPARTSIESSRSTSSNTSPPTGSTPLTGTGAGIGPYASRRRESQDITPSGIDSSGTPIVRASRHFDPATDIGVRKMETQEVLRRLMRGSGNGSGNGQ